MEHQMVKRLDHEDVMELAVQLTCSYLGSSHSGSTEASTLILDYYRQIRNVETQLGLELADMEDQEKEIRAAA
jgi:hypothetical protein